MYEGQRCYIVKTHTPGQVTHKRENNLDCRDSPEETSLSSLHEALQPRGPAPGRQAPGMSGFKGQRTCFGESQKALRNRLYS